MEIKEILAKHVTLRGCDWCIDYSLFGIIESEINQAFLASLPEMREEEICSKIKDDRYTRPCDEISCNKCERLSELVIKAYQNKLKKELEG